MKQPSKFASSNRKQRASMLHHVFHEALRWRAMIRVDFKANPAWTNDLWK
jgi:hypothetical protein